MKKWIFLLCITFACDAKTKIKSSLKDAIPKVEAIAPKEKTGCCLRQQVAIDTVESKIDFTVQCQDGVKKEACSRYEAKCFGESKRICSFVEEIYTENRKCTDYGFNCTIRGCQENTKLKQSFKSL